jgi:hypothetical protein
VWKNKWDLCEIESVCAVNRRVINVPRGMYARSTDMAKRSAPSATAFKGARCFRCGGNGVLVGTDFVAPRVDREWKHLETLSATMTPAEFAYLYDHCRCSKCPAVNTARAPRTSRQWRGWGQTEFTNV